MAESRVQGTGGEERPAQNGGDLPEPASRSAATVASWPKDQSVRWRAPRSRWLRERRPEAWLSPSAMRLVRDDIASRAAGALKGCCVEIGEGKVAHVRRTAEPFG